MAETRDELIQRGKAELRGTWPEHCLQRAFVDGARWWEFHKTGASMWQSDRHLAEAEAVKMYGVPENPPRWKVTLEQETDGRWIGEVESVPGALAYGETKEEAAVKAAEIARAAEPSPQEFYEANATNVCNVPRVGHPEDPSGWAGVRRASEARFVAGDCLVMTLADAFDFAEKYKGMADNQDSPLMRLREKIQKGGAN